MKAATHQHTCQMSPHPPNPPSMPLWRSLCHQQLPPSHTPLLLTMNRKGHHSNQDPLQGLSTSLETSTHWSPLDQLRQSSPLTLQSMPSSTPQPMGLSPLYISEPPIKLRSLPKPARTLSDSNTSTNSEQSTTTSCELNWESSAFLLALNTMEAESPPKSQQEEAKWWSQNGSGPSGMGVWNYWPGGSLGNPPTSQSSSSALTILTPSQKWWLHGSSPSLPVTTEASTLSSKKPDTLRTQQQSWRYIATAISRTSGPDSTQSLTEYQMPSPPSETSLIDVKATWNGPAYPSFYNTSKIGVPLPPPSPTSEDAIETLVKSMSSMMEHLPSGGEVSLPPSGTNWADWSNALGRKMYLRRALTKLDLELPCE